MFFKKLFRVIITFSSFVFSVHADTREVVIPSLAGKEILVISCENCPIPGKECKSYIATSTDKICIPSHTPADDTLTKKIEVSTILHQKANAEDLRSPQGDFNYPAYYVSDPVGDVDTKLGKEPLVE